MMWARKLKVLFVSVRNSSRSQMAESGLNHLYPEYAIASSASFEPGTLNPVAVEAMREVGVDISNHDCKGVLDLFATGERYDRVIGVCDQSADERCPLFPGLTVRLFWSFHDPSKFEGTPEEILEQTRQVRDDIKSHIENVDGGRKGDYEAFVFFISPHRLWPVNQWMTGLYSSCKSTSGAVRSRDKVYSASSFYDKPS